MERSVRREHERKAGRRHYLMCRPSYFDVNYSINPWMDPDKPVYADLAVAQWERLRDVVLGLGHRVDVLDPLPEQPDMVFAANGATVLNGTALVARFRHRQRDREPAAYLRWFAANGYTGVGQAGRINEGQGDFLVVGDRVLAGSGFRTEPDAHVEAAELFGLPVVTLTLVDPRFYHLDTALAVLDVDEIAYFPPAFSPDSRAVLRDLFPDAVVAGPADAAEFGLNAVSDGRHVVMPEAATRLRAQLRDRGFVPIGMDMSELLKAGGGVKCCMLELHNGIDVSRT